MEAGRRREVTTLLAEIRLGNSGARNQIVALVYDELRRLGGGRAYSKTSVSEDTIKSRQPPSVL